MSLDITLTAVRPVTVFDANVTHNLCAMAKESGVYDCVWHPHEHGIAKAAQLVEPIRAALVAMAVDPERFIALNPANGWGAFSRFVPWLERLLAACEVAYQNATATSAWWSSWNDITTKRRATGPRS